MHSDDGTSKHNQELSFTQRVVVMPDTLINIVGNEAILLNLGNEEYYGLDESGASIWQALTTNETIQAAYEKLQDEYEVSAEVLQKDMRELLEKLLAHGLVELQSE
jgi:hypothetical protein